MKSYIIYKLTFPDGKTYFGQTNQSPESRWNDGLGYYGQYVGEAIKKFGWENINKEILHNNLTKDQAKDVEKYYITKYKTVSNGYNKVGELKDINTFSDEILQIVYNSINMTTESKLLTFEEVRLKYLFYPEEEIYLQSNDSGLITCCMQKAIDIKKPLKNPEYYDFKPNNYNITWRIWQGNPTVKETMKTSWNEFTSNNI